MSRQQDTPRNAAEPASSAAAPRTGASHARRVLTPLLTVVGLLVVWELVVDLGLIPNFLLPTPVQVVQALVNDISLIVGHAATTLVETAIGLLIGVALGFAIAVLMDRFEGFYLALQPLVTISQTIPTIAIAPLLVLWFGYGLAPKVILIVITTFFPITVSLISGFRSVDPDVIDLMRTMNASRWQIFRYAKLPAAADQFFSGLRDLRHRGRGDRRVARRQPGLGRLHDARAQVLLVRPHVRGHHCHLRAVAWSHEAC